MVKYEIMCNSANELRQSNILGWWGVGGRGAEQASGGGQKAAAVVQREKEYST